MNDEVDNETRRHMMSATANPEFMSRLQEVNPKAYSIIVQTLPRHQQVLQEALLTRLQNSVEEGGRKVEPSDFFLKSENGVWVASPTQAALVPRSLRPGTRLSKTIAEDQKQALVAERTNMYQTAVMSLNMRSTIDQIIQSRAATMGIPPAEAAKMIAMEMGFNQADVKPSAPKKKELPGFGEEFRNKKKDENDG